MSHSERKYLTQKGLAARWGVSRSTIRRWRIEGNPMPKESNLGQNSRVRYAIEDVEAFEKARKADSQGA